MKTLQVYTQNRAGERLAGLRDQPRTLQTRNPTVVLAHGFGAEKREGGMFDRLAEGLTSAGFLVFRFDFSGRGESEGDYSQTSLSRLAGDLRSILDWVKQQADVDAARVALVGMSFGTTVSVALAPTDIKALVLLGSCAEPYQVLSALFLAGEKNTFDPQGISRRYSSATDFVELAPQFWSDFQSHDLLERMRQIAVPVCIIHGGSDDIAPLSGSETFFQHANEPKKLHIVNGAGHGFYEPHERAEMVREATSWFEKYL